MSGEQIVPPTTHNFQESLSKVPDEIKEISQWTFWEYKTDEDGEKSKPPVNKEGDPIDAHNPDNWLTHQEASYG